MILIDLMKQVSAVAKDRSRRFPPMKKGFYAMTVGGIVTGIIFSVVILCVCIWIFTEFCKPTLGAVVAIILVVVLWAGLFWYYNNTASGARAIKDQQSEFNNGIERHIVVKDYSGGIIAEYEGKMDIETDNETYVLFDDEEGKRHIIYNTTGFILINEI